METDTFLPSIAPDPTTPFEDLPLAVRREVLGRINRWFAIAVGGSVVFCWLLVSAVKFGLEVPRIAEIGLLITLLLLVFLLPIAAATYLLVVAAGAWPAVLPVARLASLYGIDRSALSQAALNRERSTACLGYALVGWALMTGLLALAFSLWRAVAGPRFGMGPSPMSFLAIGVPSALLMARAWRIRRVIAAHRAAAPFEPSREPVPGGLRAGDPLSEVS